MSNKIKMVRVYDFETNKATSMPACELAPGMLRVKIRGFEGEFWIDATQLKQSLQQHFEFEPECLKLFEFLSERLRDESVRHFNG
jgi:hypothetical protein